MDDEVIKRHIAKSISPRSVGRLLKRASFASTDELRERILAFIDYFSRTMAKPSKWTYAGRPLVAQTSGLSPTWCTRHIYSQSKIHLITKSDLVLQDLETIKRIAQVYATISSTITTTDDILAAKVEPYAPRPSAHIWR